MQPYSFVFLKVIAIGALAYGISLLLPSTGMHYVDIALRGSMVTILYGSLIVAFNISPEVNLLLQKTRQGFKGK
jgi:hypothetical protein